MTREQAINSMISHGFTVEQAGEIFKAVTQQEPKFIAKSDGTIEQIKNCNDCLFKKEWGKIGKLLSVVLEKQTGQEPKTGHWISHREHCENLGVMPSGLGAYEWCSNCDCGIDVREWHRNNYNYCPNCGAKMVEPQEK